MIFFGKKEKDYVKTKIEVDMGEKIKEIDRLRILINNGANFVENKRKLNRLRELQEKWREERINMWKKLVAKTDLDNNPRDFWKEVGRMMGRSKEIPKKYIQNKMEWNGGRWRILRRDGCTDEKMGEKQRIHSGTAGEGEIRRHSRDFLLAREKYFKIF